MCELGAELFRDDKRIQFLTEFPAKVDVDIVFVNSALQYFENYMETLQKLSSYNAPYILLVKLSAGEILTYATEQRNLKVTTSRYWFFNVNEIITCMLSAGYSLKYTSALNSVLNQDNFPVEYRINRTCNLLFSKVSDT